MTLALNLLLWECLLYSADDYGSFCNDTYFRFATYSRSINYCVSFAFVLRILNVFDVIPVYECIVCDIFILFLKL